MQNKILITFLFLFLLISFVSAKDPDINIKMLLEKAEALKYAEKYEEAEKLYDKVLKLDPENTEALKGKDDCRIMIEPIIPMQHLMVPPGYDDPEYRKLIKQFDNARTPWDKKRAEIALERFAMKFTGRVYVKDEARLNKRAEEIVNNAIERLKNGEPAEQVYLETDQELRSLQSKAHRGWKGHGPEILGPALEKLNAFYKNNNYPNPGRPIALSFKTSPEAAREGEMVSFTISLTNKSSSPLILVNFQLAGQDNEYFNFQEKRPGSLNYDQEKNLYYHDTAAEKETPAIFSQGLLSPGSNISFDLKARPPKQTVAAEARFVILDDETLKSVYFFQKREGKKEIYKPILMEELKTFSESSSFYVGGGLAPIYLAFIFADQAALIRTQPFTLDLGQK